jgi:hypothetical protein
MDNVEQDKIRERNQIMDDLKNILPIRNGLRVETIVKDNHELLDLLEKLKAMDGVRDAVWSEIVGTVGNKMSVPSYIIDRL